MDVNELYRANDITLFFFYCGTIVNVQGLRVMSLSSSYLIFCGICVTILKELNAIVVEPYMVQSVSWLQPISILTCCQCQG